MDDLEITARKVSDEVVLITLNGILDGMTMHRLEKTAQYYLDEGIYKFIFNLSQVSRLSSSGAGFFVKMLGVTSENCGGIVLLQPSSNVHEVLAVLGVSSYVPVTKDMDDGIKILTDRENGCSCSESKLVHHWASKI